MDKEAYEIKKDSMSELNVGRTTYAGETKEERTITW